MKLKIKDGKVLVTLSKANVLSLYHKLSVPNSARTLMKQFPAALLIVKVEDDEPHYGGSERGIMHPDTEAFIEAHSVDKPVLN